MPRAEHYIGLMSGTSVDAVDAVLLAIADEGSSFEVLGHHCCPVPPALRRQIQLLSHPGEDNVQRLGETDVAVGRLFARAALDLLAATGLEPEEITAIGSHGQTVRHAPPRNGREHPFTMQIGDPNTIATVTGITTVADFRRKDMALDGEAAPLAPGFHRAVFQAPDLNRAVVNIGGIANITWLPASHRGEPVIGFDTGPGNCLMDGWIDRHNGEAYDCGGNWARAGEPEPALLESMLGEPYLQRRPPKSTGKELFNLGWLEQHLQGLDGTPLPEAVQATLCAYTARTIADGLALVAGDAAVDEIYICGGGALNDHLVELLAAATPPTPVKSTGAVGIDPLHIEGAAFAWLAHQTLHRLPGNIPAVTGASRAAVLGGIYPP